MRQLTIALTLLAALAFGVSNAPPALAAAAECNGVAATIVGTVHADHIVGTPSRDVIVARGGDDVIDGRGGDDLICAGRGRDVVLGGGGSDEVYGQGGDDLLRGDNGADRLVGGDGDDTLFGGFGDDTLEGRRHRDTMLGQAGTDSADGGLGQNWCRGSEAVTACSTTRPTGSNVATMKRARLDATFEHIGFNWNIEGDADHDSWLYLEYRIEGTNRWKPAAPSMRAYPEVVVNGSPLGLNYHAASVMHLSNNKRYELRATVTDPDGGAATKIDSVRTRKHYNANGTVRYVVPGSGGGAGTQPNPFKGLQAAANAAAPGDIFEVAAGTYAPFEITTSGTRQQPITFRGKGEAKIHGMATERGIITIGTFDTVTSWIVIDGFELSNGHWGVDAQNTQHIWVTNNVITNVDDGITNRRGNAWERNQTVCDNVIVGRTPWPGQGIPSERGVDLKGWGNVVCHNAVADFGDCLSVQPSTGPSWGNDVFGNDARRCVDDGIEVDYNQRNVRVYMNRVYNARMGVSIQPAAGGPAYIFRNELFNLESKPVKMHNQPSGFFIVNNTGVQNGNAFTGQAGWQNAVLRNNVFLGTRYAFEFTSVSPGGFRDLNYGGWGTTRDIDPGGPWFKWDNVRYDTIDDLPGGVEPRGAELLFDALINATLPATWNLEVDPANRNLRLKNGSAGINRGTWIPNLNDRSGVAGRTDLGAHEKGAGLPIYGPRS